MLFESIALHFGILYIECTVLTVYIFTGRISIQPIIGKHNWPLPYLGILLKLYDLDFLNRKIKLIGASFYPEHSTVQVLMG